MIYETLGNFRFIERRVYGINVKVMGVYRLMKSQVI